MQGHNRPRVELLYECCTGIRLRGEADESGRICDSDSVWDSGIQFWKSLQIWCVGPTLDPEYSMCSQYEKHIGQPVRFCGTANWFHGYSVVVGSRVFDVVSMELDHARFARFRHKRRSVPFSTHSTFTMLRGRQARWGRLRTCAPCGLQWYPISLSFYCFRLLSFVTVAISLIDITRYMKITTNSTVTYLLLLVSSSVWLLVDV